MKDSYHLTMDCEWGQNNNALAIPVSMTNLLLFFCNHQQWKHNNKSKAKQRKICTNQTKKNVQNILRDVNIMNKFQVLDLLVIAIWPIHFRFFLFFKCIRRMVSPLFHIHICTQCLQFFTAAVFFLHSLNIRLSELHFAFCWGQQQTFKI